MALAAIPNGSEARAPKAPKIQAFPLMMSSTDNGQQRQQHQQQQAGALTGGMSWQLPRSPFGIPVYIHYTLPLFLLVTALPSITSSRFFYVLLMNGPILFTTVLFHEWGHCFANYRVGGSAEQILLWPMGGPCSLCIDRQATTWMS